MRRFAPAAAEPAQASQFVWGEVALVNCSMLTETFGSTPLLTLSQVLPVHAPVLTNVPLSDATYVSAFSPSFGLTATALNGSSGSAPEMSLQVWPPSAERKTWPGAAGVGGFQP